MYDWVTPNVVSIRTDNLKHHQLAALDLLGGVEAEVGMAGALVGELSDAEYLGLQSSADVVEQIGEGAVDRPLAGCSAGGTDTPEVGEIVLDGGCQFGHWVKFTIRRPVVGNVCVPFVPPPPPGFRLPPE